MSLLPFIKWHKQFAVLSVIPSVLLPASFQLRSHGSSHKSIAIKLFYLNTFNLFKYHPCIAFVDSMYVPVFPKKLWIHHWESWFFGCFFHLKLVFVLQYYPSTGKFWSCFCFSFHWLSIKHKMGCPISSLSLWLFSCWLGQSSWSFERCSMWGYL